MVLVTPNVRIDMACILTDEQLLELVEDMPPVGGCGDDLSARESLWLADRLADERLSRFVSYENYLDTHQLAIEDSYPADAFE